MSDIVGFALRLIDVAGDPYAASEWALDVGRRGELAFDRGGQATDSLVLIRDLAHCCGLLTDCGKADPPTLASLMLALSAIRATGWKRPEQEGESLVFTVPRSLAAVVAPGQRLGLCVQDVIRSARYRLRVGGPFWNAGGWDAIDEALRAAIQVRAVRSEFYIDETTHPSDEGIVDWIKRIGCPEFVRVFRYVPGAPSLMHAKFCLADDEKGYLGTANLTSQGLANNVEMGVRLTEGQARQLGSFLDSLVAAGVFHASPPPT